MEYVLLKSKVGPVEFEHRPTVLTDFGVDFGTVSKFVFRDDDGSDCRTHVPVPIWEEIRESLFNVRDKLHYKDAFKEL
jgi:hypothetical protein